MDPSSSLEIDPCGLGGIVERFLIAYFHAHEGHLPATGLYALILEEIEKPLLRETLKLVQGNQKKAAEILGINRNTLRKKLLALSLNQEPSL